MNRTIFMAPLLALGLVASACSAGQGSGLERQTNGDGPVSIAVTPHSLAPGVASWDFDVALNTHTVTLDFDLTEVAALVAADGSTQRATGWDGDGPSGHHRRGVLSFAPPAQRPQEVVLTIEGVGGVAERTFRWVLPE